MGERQEANARTNGGNDSRSPADVLRERGNEVNAEGPVQDPEGEVHAADVNAIDVHLIRDNRNHSWGAGVSLGRRDYNPHAIDPVVYANSPAEAAVSRSRLLAHPQPGMW